MSRIKHILYTSIATHALSSKELEDLLKQSRTNNIKKNITGLLLYKNRSFMQVIEGPEEQVDQLFVTICADKRHTNITKFCDANIVELDFSQWAMAFNGFEGIEIEGVSDFLRPYQSSDEQKIPEGAIKQLLRRFRQINKR